MKPVVLAPMAGVTDKPSRQIVRQFGLQTLYTEMIAVESLCCNHPMTRKMADVRDEKNIIVQLVGIRPDSFVQAAQMAQDMGAIGIDINMGCPVKKLISNGSGAALMKSPEKAAELVRVVKKAVQIPVSAKMRIGWDDDHINAVPFAKVLAEAGVDSLTVHARTRAQGYSGSARWDIVRAVKESVSVPVFVNGDVADQTSADKALLETNADGVMVGRGALGKPWLLADISGSAYQRPDLADLVCQHLALLLDYYGPHGLFVARKHLAWYAKGQKNVAQFCQNVYAETHIETVQKIIRDFFRGNT